MLIVLVQTTLFFLTQSSPWPPCLNLGHQNGRDIVALFLVIIITMSTLDVVQGASGNETDRVALLSIKSAMIDPLGALGSWNTSLHDHCSWVGITCGRRHKRVVVLDLSSSSLGGTLSPYIGNLSFLQSIHLSNNTIGGPIPPEIGSLFRLVTLVLSFNSLVGQIPSNLSTCLNLRILDLSYNKLEGTIPLEFNNFPMLKWLFVNSNNLIGPIFSSIQNLTSLEEVSGARNAFDGNLPDAIGRMKSLNLIALGSNRLTGMLPASICNLSSITVLSFQSNQLHGTVPTNIGSTLPNLRYLQLGENHFSGPLPVTLSNISSLREIQLYGNNFTGKVPWNFGNLKYLRSLDLDSNSLGSGGVDDLSFMTSLVNCTDLELLGLTDNHFGGVLPNAIGNLSEKLSALELSHNLISGTLPKSMTRLSGLVRLLVGSNQLTGPVFSDIGKLQQLEVIDFSFNMFGGIIPWSLGNLSKLSELSLSGNNFQGTIPFTLGNCKYLTIMHADQNNLTGTIPRELFAGPFELLKLGLSLNNFEGPLAFEISQQINLVLLDVSNNILSGEIPSTLGSLSSLVYLYMEVNMFRGHLPVSLGNLISIQGLALSHNNFSGPIPAYLSKLPLTYLNLSYNKFEGDVPVGGVFANTSAISLVGNSGICGGILELHLRKCPGKEVVVSKAKISFKLKLIISAACALIVVVAVIVFASYCMYCRKKQRHSSLPVSFFRDPFFKVSYKMLLEATHGFSSSNFLGAGTFGSVYKGVLEHDNTTVAVKVLNLQQPGAARSFVAECEALRNVRHRNLVSVITACSSVDYQGNDFKALVYEYMHCGSLDSWLHSNDRNDNGALEVRNLSLVQRVNIAQDVASALEYLHHDCEVPIVHRDLKPSNVLLDNDMVAHVGDFGMAKFLPQPLHPNHSTSTGVIKGTVGYVSPEYGLRGDPSVASDIYSYGILLLEMMTQKRPTDEIFKDGLNLHTFVRMALPDQVLHIVDTRLLNSEGHVLNNLRTPRQAAKWMNCVITRMKIGVACSMESPQNQINLKDASVELLKVKNDLVRDFHFLEHADTLP